MKYGIKIPLGANFLIDALQNNGYSAYVVGGCVRDSILGREPHDWDICTSATPDQMLEVFKGEKVIETGVQHGTITVVLDEESYEITTYRIDGEYSDSRRPDSVTFTDSLIEDLSRRDFTINAMAYNDAQGLIDPFDGIKDLGSKKIQCVGNARDRFSEDALRILRAIRFAAQLGFDIESETDSQIYQLYKSLEDISAERINSEFCKIVSSDNFWLALFRYRGVFALFIPELKDMFGFPQNNPWHDYNVFDHTLYAVTGCISKDLITKLATFFHDFGKPHSYQDDSLGIRHFRGHAQVSAEITNNVMKRLRFDNDTREKVVELVKYHDAVISPTKKHIKRMLSKIGEEQFCRLIDVKRADNAAQNLVLSSARIEELNAIKHLVKDILREQECFSLKDLAVNGRDLMSIGYKQGQIIGNTLRRLLDLVVDEEVENQRDALLEMAKFLLQSEDIKKE